MAQPTPQARRRGLGMGLSALLGEAEPQAHPEQAGTLRVPIEFLRPSPFQPRRAFAEDELEALAASLREHGVLQPLLVRPASGAAGYEIVAGERRWRAAQKAALHNVPVIVRDLSDVEAAEFALIENVQRADLNPIEEAAGYSELMERFGYTQEQVSEVVGKSRSHLANMLRLLKLPMPVQVLLQEGKLTAGHARALIGHGDAMSIARRIVDEDLNVREVELLVQEQQKDGEGSGKSKSKPARDKDADTRAFEKDMTDALGLRVEIRRGSGESGQLTISFGNFDQLEYIRNRLVNPRL
jgi:ParB family chromosome partitioning protein